MRNNVGPPAGVNMVAHIFAALGDEVRLGLVSRLCSQGPTSITGLTEGTHITRQAITKHLRLMERSGLVHSKRAGRESVWQLERDRIDSTRRYLKTISKQWDSALERLRAYVEQDPS